MARQNILYRDLRYGDMQRWFIGVPPTEAMRVPDEWLSSVFFLALDTSRDGIAQTHYLGTGFYFWLENEYDATLSRLYLVTARHVIAAVQNSPAPMYARLNTEDHSSIMAELKKEWVFHEDDTVDIAVHGVQFTGVNPPAAEIVRLHPDACLNEDRIRKHDIGVGSDVTVIGMFFPRPGDARNIPVVRSGVIAAMPGEPIYDETSRQEPYVAYLVEVLSLSGLSGSPVFVHPLAGPLHKHPITESRGSISNGVLELQQATHTEWNQPSFVLGVVRSHYDEQPPEERPRPEWINKGIAPVTPIDRVLEVLDYDTFKRDRRADADEARKRRSAVLD